MGTSISKFAAPLIGTIRRQEAAEGDGNGGKRKREEAQREASEGSLETDVDAKDDSISDGGVHNGGEVSAGEDEEEPAPESPKRKKHKTAGKSFSKYAGSFEYISDDESEIGVMALASEIHIPEDSDEKTKRRLQKIQRELETSSGYLASDPRLVPQEKRLSVRQPKQRGKTSEGEDGKEPETAKVVEGDDSSDESDDDEPIAKIMAKKAEEKKKAEEAKQKAEAKKKKAEARKRSEAAKKRPSSAKKKPDAERQSQFAREFWKTQRRSKDGKFLKAQAKEPSEEISAELRATLTERQPKHGRWTLTQELLFLYHLEKLRPGKGRWQELATHVPGRDYIQCKSHAQKQLRQKDGHDIYKLLDENKAALNFLLNQHDGSYE